MLHVSLNECVEQNRAKKKATTESQVMSHLYGELHTQFAMNKKTDFSLSKKLKNFLFFAVLLMKDVEILYPKSAKKLFIFFKYFSFEQFFLLLLSIYL